MRFDEQYVSMPRLFLAAAERFPGLEAIVDGDRRISYPELSELAVASTRAAVAAGLAPGDRAAIWAPNSADWIVAALGILGAGGVLVTLNTRFKGAEAAYVLGKAGARLLFTVNGFLDTDYPAMLRAGAAETGEATDVAVVVLDGPAGSDRSWSDYLAAGAGVSEADCKAHGFSAADFLREKKGFSFEKAVALGFSLKELVGAGFNMPRAGALGETRAPV